MKNIVLFVHHSITLTICEKCNKIVKSMASGTTCMYIHHLRNDNAENEKSQ